MNSKVNNVCNFNFSFHVRFTQSLVNGNGRRMQIEAFCLDFLCYNQCLAYNARFNRSYVMSISKNDLHQGWPSSGLSRATLLVTAEKVGRTIENKTCRVVALCNWQYKQYFEKIEIIKTWVAWINMAGVACVCFNWQLGWNILVVYCNLTYYNMKKMY